MPYTQVVRVTTTNRLPLMQRIGHALQALRSYTLGPFTPPNWPGPEAGFWGTPSVSSGVSVSEDTALNYSAVFSAVSIISADISSLPLMLYKRLPGGGKDRFEDHRLYPLLHDSPNPEMGSMVFRETLQAHLLLWGNAYAEIERDKSNRPVALWPLTPDRVTPMRDKATQALVYRVSNQGQPYTYLDPMQILHVAGLGFDGICGYSVVAKARESMGLGLAAEQFGASFFGNGTNMGGVISYPTDPSQQVKEKNREALEKRHGGIANANKLLAIYGGAKYERMGVPPDDAQFLETRVFQVRDVARWFKLPPHKLADLADATFSNVEQQNIDYYTSCLRPWLEKWEQELERKLISQLERRQQFVEHVVDGLLRADATGRAALETAHFNIGATTPNEIRGQENRDPIPGGDRAFVPLNMIPLDKVDAWVDAQIKSQTAPKTTPAPPTEDQMNAFIDVLERQIVARDTDIEKHRTAAQAAETARDEAQQQVVTLQRDRVETGQRLETLTAALAQARADQAAQEGQSTADRDRLQAEVDRLTEQLRTEQTGKNDVDVMLGVAEKQQAATQQALEEALKQEAVAVERARAVTAERDALAQRVANAQTAMRVLQSAQRDVLIHAVQCIVQRESDRARKAVASPDKLRKWADSFYTMHDEYCRSALRPSFRAWFALVGGAGFCESALDGFIGQYIDESRAHIAAVLDEDAETVAPALERVLRRWETERAAAVVDRFIGEAHV